MALYVIECAGLLKIGYSQDPEKRTRNLFQSNSRYSAPRAAYEARGTQRLLFVAEGATKSDESAVHAALEDYSIGCEWFVNEPAVIEFVKAFAPGDLPAPVARPEGNAYDATPAGERGGCNYDLCMSLVAKRRERVA